MKRIALMSLVASSVMMAGGWKIPETSLNGVALSAANIAHNKSADAAYYNPANMIFMEDKNEIEFDLIYIGLDAIHYEGKHTSGATVFNGGLDAQQENFIIPTIHYVSEKTGNARIGLSIVSPGGLSKRWQKEPAKASAEEFTLKIVEINPSVALEINDKLAFAFGFRILHTSGIVKSDGFIGAINANASRDMTGTGIDYGYNIALSYKPTSDLDIALTYRSKVNLNVTGNAKLSTNRAGGATYDGGTSLTIPLPATFSAAIAYTLPSKTTFEFVYEQTMWSAYKDLDFDYDSSFSGTPGGKATLTAVFDNPKAKNWHDTNAFRLGITQELKNMTLMAGAVYDRTPAPESTLGFELPDSNSFAVSLGGRYQINEKMEVGLSALYSMREKRKVKNDHFDGEFSNANVLIISTGISYKF
ncbi:OmpP1/FadL family transporter [Sulfurimonas sp.]|uniref:OmpP1/FadL family transporter n=1 Tax=Sulfurimonas sp. TaxID=2022749 RepID=UPI002AB25F11|nr:outer membrane protein transport protein [Sulfurimonas sp.]